MKFNFATKDEAVMPKFKSVFKLVGIINTKIKMLTII